MATIKTYHVTGHVIDISDPQEPRGAVGLRVNMFPVNGDADQPLLKKDAVTSRGGRFDIEFSESDLKDRYGKRRPDFFFKVWDKENGLIRRTDDLVIWKLNSRVKDVVIEVKPAADDGEQRGFAASGLTLSQSAVGAEQEFVVRGLTLDEGGSPVAGVIVGAFDRDLRREQPLGQVIVGDDGRFEIRYSAEQFRNPEKSNADLVVKAAADDGSLLVSSAVLFNAPQIAEVNLTIPGEKRSPLSEFEKIAREVEPHLEGVAVVELEENERFQDISFLAGETGIPAERIFRFALASRLRAASSIEAEFWYALLATPFYQTADTQSVGGRLSVILAALPSLDAEAVRRALTTAFSQNLIPWSGKEKVAAWTETFLQFVARQTVSGEGREAVLKSALEDAGITDAQRQERFARLFAEHRGLTPELVEILKGDASFEAAEIADLQTTFLIAGLAQGNFSAARVLKRARDVRRPEDVRLLAKTSEEDWVKLAKENVASGDLRLPIEIAPPEVTAPVEMRPAEAYGKMLERQFREAFPTTAFAGGLERALNNGGARGVKRPELLAGFLGAHEEFEFLNTPVDDFLNNKLRPEQKHLAQDENFRQELKAAQRVFKLAPTFEASDALLADDLHSAQKIYRMGESEFARNYAERPGFTAETARRVWNRAAETHAAALTIVGELQAMEAEGLPSALLNQAKALPSAQFNKADGLPVALLDNNAAIEQLPNWNNLFKAGDLCECEHCRSVYSPAAYFADLLMFLKERKAKNPAQTVKDILFERRPDLGYIELNCENALTPLPYIDVVCEVLEDVVADGANDLELAGLTSIPDASPATKAAVASAFAAEGVSLGADFTLSQIGAGDRWVTHGDSVTYLLKKKAAPNYFAEILRNTKAPAAELRANPQYVNPEAYAKLKSARYPFALPFDLFNEEARAAFQKIAVKRWELMRTLRGPAAPNNPSDGDIAAEYFGISVDGAAPTDEKRIILTAAPTDADQQVFWGEAAIPGNLSNVKVFLQKTGLEFNELLALLDLKFVNPSGDIAVSRPDPTCDTDKMILEGLDAAKLDRIHRFLRLWHKLKGWQMWELDLAIRHPAVGAGDLNELFLINLMRFAEVKNRLGGKVTVEQTAALFGALNTTTRFTALHEKRKDALYQNLFLNRKLIHPLDMAFQLDPVTGDLPVGETITAHQPVVQAALGLRESDLLVFKGLTKASDGNPYINDDLNLANLSFLYRHAWLAKTLKFKAEEWKIVLKLFDQDVAAFASPQSAWDFLEKADRLKKAGFSVDELNWLLAADGAAKAAVKETGASRFLFGLRKELQAVRSEYDAAKYDFLQASPPTDETQLEGLLTALLQKLNRDEAGVGFFMATLRGDVVSEAAAPSLPAGFDFPPALAPPIRYDEPAQTLRFTGVMTTAERAILLNDPTLAAVTGIAAYKQAVEDLFQQPRLAVKFHEPVFTSPLETLPPPVDFKTQLPAGLAARITYDAEQRLLRFNGVMSRDERAALDALVPNVLPVDVAYHNAVDSLAMQPQTIVPPDERVWLTGNDLDDALPANDTFAKRLANAANKALAHLSKTFAENTVVEQVSENLGLTPAVARAVVTRFELIAPGSILDFFTGAFSTTSAAIDYAGFKDAFGAWYWLNRVAAILKKWKINLEELEAVVALQIPAQLLDFETLPIDDSAPVAPLDAFLRSALLFKLRDTLPETGATLLDALQRLNSGAYAAAADFAADAQLINEAWNAADVEAFTQSLDIAYPAGYLLAENWERLRRAFGFLDKLNCAADTATAFANATVGKTESDALKQLLRSKFGAETWLTLSAEIQDALRERKRDALVAWMLHQHTPANPAPPSGKWENANDVYAYYLLDVEMSSCQLTSRLVQASGSVQLFVQRCFMGLEPDVIAQADGDDGDSAWRWWKWMKKYRVWEANRKVFLYPENWIEPELRRDKSQFFKDLENELLQNEINQANVETAFLNYLEKLDGVAQLEIAGFYQEDDADRTILHVFGRTKGGEPHLYYYRQFDYRRWTPWEKVELDITGDYLIPAVINKRVFLFWPVFTETPDEAANKTVTTPNLNSPYTVPETHKRLQLQMAVSEYRQGTWTPKRVSTDRYETGAYTGEIIKNRYRFWAVDRVKADGRFGIRFEGYSEPKFPIFQGDKFRANINGSFELVGCKGVPEITDLPGSFAPPLKPDQSGDAPKYLKWTELQYRTDPPENDFSFLNTSAALLQASPGSLSGPPLAGIPILMQTPNIFKMSPPWHLSYMDKFWLDLPDGIHEGNLPAGSWLPFFYADKKRTFFTLPSIAPSGRGRDSQTAGSVRLYYPEIKRGFRQLEDFFEGQIRTFVDGIDLSALTQSQRQQLEEFLRSQFPAEEAQPPYSDQKLRDLMTRFWMRYFNYWLGYFSLLLFQFRQFHFKNHYHPFVCEFAKLVYNPLKGIPALMSRETQLKNSGFRFKSVYVPTMWVVEPGKEDFYPAEDVDFRPDGAYSPYNWELFFHAPLMIANQLSGNQRFEEAMQWYHYIFNPIGVESGAPGGSSISKYWITKPFYETTDEQYMQQRIDSILRMLAGDTTVQGFAAQLKKELEDQVLDWRDNPFEPHRIAQYRKVAYQKTTVMKYLDNLIAWGDNLFRQDSMESVNEATQLYILAAEILGPRPRKIPPKVKPPVESFNELEDQFDRFSNALVQVENVVPPQPGGGQNGGNAAPLPTLYFCIPHNEKLLGYWDTVADRLFKIRHCMNIEGVARQLALFEPPIDPGALVKAVAGGLDISSALADLNAPLPLYRFNALLQKANEVCNDVKSLGGALLSALEKKDAEALSLLRQSQEIKLLEGAKEARQMQIDEAKENLEGLKRSKAIVEVRRNYYRDIEKLIDKEQLHLDKLGEAHSLQEAAQGVKLAASIISYLPAIDIGASGFGGSPVAKFKIGGLELGQAADLAAEALGFLSLMASNDSTMASSQASFDRRWEDWKLQERLAEKELDQMDKQIAAAEVRIKIAEKELDSHILQIENAKATDEFMRSKYTNRELYQWHTGQISQVYFRSYQLAYDLAKRAERCFRFELGLQDSSFIQFGYWDSLKKGLLSGEKLQYDLRRLEAAYLEQNRREFELTKHISLAMLDPLALVRLRETGRCFFKLPEEIFDLDYPGHYFRRIKSVSITLPCVAGPYTTISCTLRLLKNSVRVNTANGDNGYARNTDDLGLPADDSRFIENNIPVKAVAGSHAQNDSGVFELNFRDERYLPFEGAGTISEWSVELFNDPDQGNPDFGKPLRQFDYNSISDAILHVKYTAREDAGTFKNGAITRLREYFDQAGTTNALRMFDLRREFPGQWHRFLNPANPADGNVFELEMAPGLFPMRDQGKTLKVNSIWLLARCLNTEDYNVVMTPPLPAPPPTGSDTMTLAQVNQYGGLHFSQKDVSALGIEAAPADPPVKWLLNMTRPGGGNLEEDPVKKVMEVEDMLLVLGYEWNNA
jgi:receptor-binding and translocation channel-forming TcA subunit of Tc toxin/ABC toxin-like protein/neuraminidase-like protein